ncbi:MULTISPECIES: hypothetical protein [Pseudofrankia]|uniref:hypothetical protein n=1 Tax=Pseudofrankia TaxID=2994363 RepID=UPI000234D8B2|nr:hypothetical protein BCD49_33070 [Pseudofrankia sp. EUN1h]
MAFSAATGPWYLDVGHHIASVLSDADRRKRERDLLAHYLDRLRAGGVETPAWDEVWSVLGRGVLDGFYLWGVTVKVDPPSPPHSWNVSERPPPTTTPSPRSPR